MNVINKLREETLYYFSRNNKIIEGRTDYVSEDNKYHIVKNVFRQTKPGTNWNVAEIEIFDSKNLLISTLLIDDAYFFHKWMKINNIQYLLFAERLCGGNSILNLNTGSMQSFADGTDGFICVEYFPSLDNKFLAVSGCFWGSPNSVMVYDIANAENLPWPVLTEIDLDGLECSDLTWDGSSLVIYKNVNDVKSVSRKLEIK